ncbi:hypothetical protein Bra3105_06595 [Brachybacterium halotolerans subsp. kimchii]|uniref:hypothetical protein n=1 Tax=Brachybacterium halotolerans TaxID=2795215 RepID=UPI001E5C9619|nr:hypothetical protein [Brachybacterium halotolerans]UEJ83975.1 hypothetical protein Bra3105_06595 [Brachybacterium halotolerans subsp. kimchii]
MSITDRARAEAERLLTDERGWGVLHRTAFELGAQWAAYLPPTDEEVLAALNARDATMYPAAPPETSLAAWSGSTVDAMRAALAAAQEAQR